MGSFPLSVVEIRRDGDYNPLQRFAKQALRIVFKPLQDQGGDRLRRVLFSGIRQEMPVFVPDRPFDILDGISGLFHRQLLGHDPNKRSAVLVEVDRGGSGSIPLPVFQNLRAPLPVQIRDGGERRSQINSRYSHNRSSFVL